MYAKLINEQLKYSPLTIMFNDGECICNPSDIQLLQNGYKLINKLDIPLLNNNEYIVEVYTENEFEITIGYEIKNSDMGGID